MSVHHFVTSIRNEKLSNFPLWRKKYFSVNTVYYKYRILTSEKTFCSIAQQKNLE